MVANVNIFCDTRIQVQNPKVWYNWFLSLPRSSLVPYSFMRLCMNDINSFNLSNQSNQKLFGRVFLQVHHCSMFFFSPKEEHPKEGISVANLSAPSTAVSTLHYLLTRTNVPCVTRVLFTTEISGAPKRQQEKKTDPVKKLIYIFLKLFLTCYCFSPVLK